MYLFRGNLAFAHFLSSAADCRLVCRETESSSMATSMSDFTEILLRQGIISANQLAEAQQMARASGTKVSDALVRLGYATSDEVMRAVAQEHGYDFVNLAEVVIPPAIVELVPESVARENAILPMDEHDGALKVIISDP